MNEIDIKEFIDAIEDLIEYKILDKVGIGDSNEDFYLHHREIAEARARLIRLLSKEK